MKKLLTVVCYLAFTAIVQGQTVEDFFNGSDVPVHWLGIDFSHVQLVGEFAQFGGIDSNDAEDLRREYFPGWNMLILNEPKKYDLKEAFRRSDMIMNVDMIMKHNANAETKDMKTYSPKTFKNEEIKNFVSLYDLKESKGLGLVFIAEALNKTTESGSFQVVVFNLESKEILLAERVTGKPQGFGIRNYWAGAIHKIIKEIDDTHYEFWKRKL